MCRNWKRLLDALGGPEEPVKAALGDVLDAQSSVAPKELKLASRIMLQRLTTMMENESPEVGTMVVLSYVRLAAACRDAGVTLERNSSLS